MPAQQIARNLAFVNWTALASLAVGTLGAVVLLRLWTDATKGYLGFTALCAAAFGALAWISDGALPALAGAGSPISVDPSWDLPRRALLALLAVGSLAYSVALFRGARAPLLGIGTLAVWPAWPLAPWPGAAARSAARWPWARTCSWRPRPAASSSR